MIIPLSARKAGQVFQMPAAVKKISAPMKNIVDKLPAKNHTAQVININRVTTVGANGDLMKEILQDADAEMLRLANNINKIFEQLDKFALKITGLAKVAGTDRKLNSKAEVKSISREKIIGRLTKPLVQMKARIKNSLPVTMVKAI